MKRKNKWMRNGQEVGDNWKDHAFGDATKKARALCLVACAWLAVVFVMVGCATLKPHAKTANDIARDLCNATLGAEDVPVGITVEDACNLHRFVDPFLRAILGAQQTAAAQIAASSGGDAGQ